LGGVWNRRASSQPVSVRCGGSGRSEEQLRCRRHGCNRRNRRGGRWWCSRGQGSGGLRCRPRYCHTGGRGLRCRCGRERALVLRKQDRRGSRLIGR
jgi:hypothetical protein